MYTPLLQLLRLMSSVLLPSIAAPLVLVMTRPCRSTMLIAYWPAAVALNVMRASPVVGLGYTAMMFNASVVVNSVSTVSSVRALSMPALASSYGTPSYFDAGSTLAQRDGATGRYCPVVGHAGDAAHAVHIVDGIFHYRV